MSNAVLERYHQLISDGKNRIHDSGQKTTLYELDDKLLKQGCHAFNRHFFSMFVCMLSGLLSLMYVPSIVQVLHNTKQSSTPEKTFLRYLKTLNHVVQWYKLSKEDRLQSLKKVRSIHSAVAKDNTITQYDMVITQWAFIAPAFLKTTQIGMDTASQRELDGIRYIFYIVGQALGIEEEYNLCSLELSQTKDLMEMILQNDIKHVLKTEVEKEPSDLMSSNLLQAIHMINPFLKPTSFKYWCFQLLECPLHSDTIKSHRLSYSLISTLFGKLLCGNLGLMTRPILNSLMKANIYLANLWRHHILHENRRPFLTFLVTIGLFTIALVILLIIIAMFMYCVQEIIGIISK